MQMEVSFPGGMAVNANFGDHIIPTDQPTIAGGDGEAPSPFALFVGSIATCAGFFALRFCQERKIDTEGMQLTCKVVRDPGTKKLETVKIDLKLPEGFPEKYSKAIIRTMDQCAVKRAILDPPEFEVVTS